MTNKPTLIAIAILLSMNLPGCLESQAEEAVEIDPTVLKVEILQVVSSTESMTRRYSGYTFPLDATGVGFMVYGRIKNIAISEGDHIEEGTLIATLDTTDYALVKKLRDIQANTLEPNVTRMQGLVDKRVLPKSNLDELEGQYKVAVTQREQARMQLTHTRLKSPVSGVVHEIMAAEGQVIGAGRPVATILDLSTLKLVIGVSQPDLKYFRVGDTHTVSIPGVATTYQATVSNVDFVSNTKTRTFEVTLEIPNEKSELRASLLCHINVVTEQSTGIFVPLYALKTNSAGKPIVMLYDKSSQKAVERVVGPGDVFGEKVNIISGLKEGETLIVKGHEFVKHNDKVLVP